jgi:uncharacterized protein YndB with AHSA1/START domain
MSTETDRIEKKIMLHASRERVWRALTDASEFGTWFGVKFESPFSPGATVHGTMVPTTVDPDVARLQQEFEGFPFQISVERIEPQRLFSFRWHPHAIERGVDYSAEPTTLVEFALEEVANGIMLTVTESGFDRVPLARRVQAFSANEQGWGLVGKVIEKYLAQSA